MRSNPVFPISLANPHGTCPALAPGRPSSKDLSTISVDHCRRHHSPSPLLQGSKMWHSRLNPCTHIIHLSIIAHMHGNRGCEADGSGQVIRTNLPAD
ncbi:unnamed protein product [Chondrus crispus]|uniref:Uncharacterized protein n=1 Tax=Chondrus crispus TaxID=2769 RepID=R7Q624_CHOCR|nr:unnamed protein product [Chondrus crispus]CDF32841.1 unnamed protein product [Chondrus crispus]|eukprot:XP_005712642.1 unnamed protein product [Chondrus crispus]